MIRTSYLVLFIFLGAIGVGTASALITITLAGDVIVTGDLDVEGEIRGSTISELENKFNLLDNPPTVDAGDNFNVLFGNNATLDGTIADEGLPSGIITSSWSKQSGLGTVTFTNSSNVDTTANFTETGQYQLRLTANDGGQSSFDEVTANVLIEIISHVSVPQGTGVPGCEETNECFIPFEIIINVGETVTWTNDDSAAHTVTSGSAADGPSGDFDSSLFMAGTTFDVQFDTPGQIPYFCMVHPWMEGVVTVLTP